MIHYNMMRTTQHPKHLAAILQMLTKCYKLLNSMIKPVTVCLSGYRMICWDTALYNFVGFVPTLEAP